MFTKTRLQSFAFLYCIAMIFYFINWLLFCYQTSNDTISYFEPAKNVIDAAIYGYRSTEGTIFPSAMRTPVLPGLLGLLFFFTKDMDITYSLFTFGMILLAPVYPITAWVLGRKINRSLALACYCAVLFSFNLLNFATYVLTDFLLGIFLNALILTALISSEKLSHRNRGFIMGGLVAAAALLRPTMIYYLPVLFVGLTILHHRKAALRMMLPAALVFGIVVSPWIVRNTMTFQKPIFTTFAGASLTWSIGNLINTDGNESAEVLAAKNFIKENTDDPSEFVHYKGRDYYLANPLKADSTLKEIAMDTYRSNPLGVMKACWVNLHSTLCGIMTTIAYSEKVLTLTKTTDNRVVNYLCTIVIYINKYFYNVFVPLGCFTLLIRKFRLTALPVLTCGYIFGLTSLVSGYDRFRVPLESVMIWMGCYGIYTIVIATKKLIDMKIKSS